ncbi:hypothetical protein BJ508DRAFT_412236 [Ascobolus immersus RN42]|uniref:L domain-like protein n=1 Tax=Ascobolus immersus RN42 TaxID=1160509 RepID=A0A3N4II45_ASCIM|nr:hypothetical protein BJ508DRAFT_412236 [Ascobolus immersus RN42]
MDTEEDLDGYYDSDGFFHENPRPSSSVDGGVVLQPDGQYYSSSARSVVSPSSYDGHTFDSAGTVIHNEVSDSAKVPEYRRMLQENEEALKNRQPSLQALFRPPSPEESNQKPISTSNPNSSPLSTAEKTLARHAETDHDDRHDILHEELGWPDNSSWTEAEQDYEAEKLKERDDDREGIVDPDQALRVIQESLEAIGQHQQNPLIVRQIRELQEKRSREILRNTSGGHEDREGPGSSNTSRTQSGKLDIRKHQRQLSSGIPLPSSSSPMANSPQLPAQRAINLSGNKATESPRSGKTDEAFSEINIALERNKSGKLKVIATNRQPLKAKGQSPNPVRQRLSSQPKSSPKSMLPKPARTKPATTSKPTVGLKTKQDENTKPKQDENLKPKSIQNSKPTLLAYRPNPDASSYPSSPPWVPKLEPGKSARELAKSSELQDSSPSQNTSHPLPQPPSENSKSNSEASYRISSTPQGQSTKVDLAIRERPVDTKGDWHLVEREDQDSSDDGRHQLRSQSSNNSEERGSPYSTVNYEEGSLRHVSSNNNNDGEDDYSGDEREWERPESSNSGHRPVQPLEGNEPEQPPVSNHQDERDSRVSSSSNHQEDRESRVSSYNYGRGQSQPSSDDREDNEAHGEEQEANGELSGLDYSATPKSPLSDASPQVQAPPERIASSPLKLFAPSYDPATKSLLERRMSELTSGMEILMKNKAEQGDEEAVQSNYDESDNGESHGEGQEEGEGSEEGDLEEEESDTGSESFEVQEQGDYFEGEVAEGDDEEEDEDGDEDHANDTTSPPSEPEFLLDSRGAPASSDPPIVTPVKTPKRSTFKTPKRYNDNPLTPGPPPSALRSNRRRKRSHVQTPGIQTRNDMLFGPISPLKARTPKRIRRTETGDYMSSKRNETIPPEKNIRRKKKKPDLPPLITNTATLPVLPTLTLPPAKKAIKNDKETSRPVEPVGTDFSPSTTMKTQTSRAEHADRELMNSSPSPSPRRRSNTLEDASREDGRKKAKPLTRNRKYLRQTENVNVRQFKGFQRGGSFDNSDFEPEMGAASVDGKTTIGSKAGNPNSTTSSTNTKKFLNQAEEVLERIRGLKNRIRTVEEGSSKRNASASEIGTRTNSAQSVPPSRNGQTQDGDEESQTVRVTKPVKAAKPIQKPGYPNEGLKSSQPQPQDIPQNQEVQPQEPQRAQHPPQPRKPQPQEQQTQKPEKLHPVQQQGQPRQTQHPHGPRKLQGPQHVQHSQHPQGPRRGQQNKAVKPHNLSSKSVSQPPTNLYDPLRVIDQTVLPLPPTSEYASSSPAPRPYDYGSVGTDGNHSGDDFVTNPSDDGHGYDGFGRHSRQNERIVSTGRTSPVEISKSRRGSNASEKNQDYHRRDNGIEVDGSGMYLPPTIRGSDQNQQRNVSASNVQLIALSDVQHLIGRQVSVGSMDFDREKRMWVKKKEHQSSESDEDPFYGIPDLSTGPDDSRTEPGNRSNRSIGSLAKEVEEFILADEEESPAHQRILSDFDNTLPPYTPDDRRERRVSFGERSETSADDERIDEPSSQLTRYELGSPRRQPIRKKPSLKEETLRRLNENANGQMPMRKGNGSDRFGPASRHLNPSAISAVGSSSALTALPTPYDSPEARQNRDLITNSSVVRTGQSMQTSSPLPDLSYRFEATGLLLNLELQHFATQNNLYSRPREVIEDRFSLAAKKLVECITDEYPFELNWEEIRSLNFSSKKLETLHRLNEHCPYLEELDASDNEIGQVSGVPQTVRTLNMNRNCLSNLTSWGHLVNLQYLDISNNSLESLAGLKHMVHLRELVVDGNQIDGLKEVMGMDGLLVLRARKNVITEVDFTDCRLKRLSELDLRSNRIENIRGLECLPSLSALILDENRLTNLNVPEDKYLPSIRSLRLGFNKFESLDLSPFPMVKVLFLDGNSLGKLDNLHRSKHLDTLSVRNQLVSSQGQDNSTLQLAEFYEIRKLYASRNRFRELDIPLDFMNLQYLELANVQLATLPKDFGQLMCNVRFVNLNYNAIQDIRALYGMVRLKKLLLAGNRIKSMKKIAAVLKYFPHLSTVDFRLNPLTQGFYPPQSTEPLKPTRTNDSYAQLDPFTLKDAESEQDEKFAENLDMETAIFRRRYMMLMGNRLRNLKRVDGLEYKRSVMYEKDEVWREMEKRGLLLGDSHRAEEARS